ncbi:Sensor histidine kinase TodS [Thalassocella blandensis]|nr:Sensor histidine kinase TodS [Thalassocella blandensis]
MAQYTETTLESLYLRKFPRLLLMCVSTFLFLSFSPLTRAQAVNKQQITASYIYNFAKNIEWPNEPTKQPFLIGLYAVDGVELFDELKVLESRFKLRDRPIRVERVRSAKALSGFDLIYTDQARDAVLNNIYDVIDAKPVLLVTEQVQNKHLVMVNLLFNNSSVTFEVNKSNIINQGLKPLPELILNGGTEVDVAQLFREGRNSLVNLQQQLQSREEDLNKLTQSIDRQEQRNKDLEIKLTRLSDSIEKSNLLIERQAQLLQEQHDKINVVQQELNSRTEELYSQKEKLDQSQHKLEDIRTEIDLREARLSSLNGRIRDQEDQIVAQKGAISELDELVSSQKKALTYSRGMAVLAFLLVVTILIAYIIKRRDNMRLAAHSQDLQLARDRLDIAKRKAEDASEAKSEFLSLMSHELRTPLQAIIGYTDVLIEELRFDGNDTHVKDLVRVNNNGERLLKLINGVLDLAKIESGRMELNLVDSKLSTLVEEAVDNVKPQMQQNNNVLELDVDDGDAVTRIDPEKFLHILINLLSNAAKFTENGSVSAVVKHESNRIYISVEDSGIGMTAEQQRTVFDRFKQADTTITQKFQGSGLGLSITRQFCELMGGSIFVESELNKGAKFVVTIPLPIVEVAEFGERIISDENTIEHLPDQSKGPRILLIDDDPAFLDIMARAMVREGYVVATANCAEDGLRLAREIKPKVITLDLLLPDQHGWMVFEEIKKDPELQDIPVIVVSIVDDPHDKRIRADGYLTKPIARESLKVAVKKLVPR